MAYHSPAGAITPLDIIYGFRPSIAQGNTYMAHRCGFTETALRGTLVANGFASVAAMRRPAAYDLSAVASIPTLWGGGITRHCSIAHPLAMDNAFEWCLDPDLNRHDCNGRDNLSSWLTLLVTPECI